jgi:hypothetical protein
VLEKPPGFPRNGISTLNFLDWQRQNTVFEYMAAQTGRTVTLSGLGEPIQLRATQVSARYFDIFGIKPMLGRTFAADEDQRGNERVALVSRPTEERYSPSTVEITTGVSVSGLLLRNRRSTSLWSWLSGILRRDRVFTLEPP